MDFGMMVNQLTIITSAIINVAAVVTLIYTVAKKAKSPNELQDKRIEALEKDVGNFRRFFDNDKKRIDAIEEGNKVTQKALLALMGHAINGNDIDELKKAKSNLEKYLVDR